MTSPFMTDLISKKNAKELTENKKQADSKKSLFYKTEKTTGWQFPSTAGVNASIAHDVKMSAMPLTIDVLIAIDMLDVAFGINTELMILNKPNSWVFKIMPDLKFYFDTYNGNTSAWTGPISSKTKINFQLINETNLESYGASQGLTTDEDYLYTTNNRLDMNQYNIMKRKLDGTLITGITLPIGFSHPCGICCVGGLLYVPANNYPDAALNKIYVIDTIDMSIIKYFDVMCSTPAGISGIAYKNGYFYASDWKTAGTTNIFVYDSNFNLVATKTIDTLKVQGIEIADNVLLAISNDELSIISYDIDTFARISTYPYYAEIEGEDICVTKSGTILHADVSTIREYCIAEGSPSNNKVGEHFERLTATIENNAGAITYKFYRNGVLQSQKTYTGTLNTLATYGTLMSGSWNNLKNVKHKVKALGISNSVIVPTKDNREMFTKGRYDVSFVDGLVGTATMTDSVSNLTITKNAAVYNYNVFEV